MWQIWPVTYLCNQSFLWTGSCSFFFFYTLSIISSCYKGSFEQEWLIVQLTKAKMFMDLKRKILEELIENKKITYTYTLTQTHKQVTIWWGTQCLFNNTFCDYILRFISFCLQLGSQTGRYPSRIPCLICIHSTSYYKHLRRVIIHPFKVKGLLFSLFLAREKS